MLTLNLVDEAKSDFKYKISKFPDGQQSFEILHPLQFQYKKVQIKSRLNSFRDLELIICANQALRNLDSCEDVELYVPSFLGARSDRKFNVGGINYLKQVIGPIINSQNFDRVTVMDPHSDVLEACLHNFDKKSNLKLVKFALEQIDNKNGAQDRVALISPDAGALKKIYDVAKFFRIPRVFTAAKVRDVLTGEIVRTEMPVMDLEGIEHLVIIDDICDGGRTFIELAKEIRKQTDKPIYLVVTHGIFSAGFEKLSEALNGVFCTNSIQDINSNTFVKQLDVF